MVLISASSPLISPFSFPSRKKPLVASPTVPRTRESSPQFQFPSRTLRPTPLRTLKCLSRRQSTEEFERLFSNLNQATMKREPGSVTSGIFLVTGTTVVTGLLIAEVNVNTMCELGSGGVSLVSMATRTLGKLGVQTACLSYIFIHYALLVAYVARSSEILTNSFGIPLWESATLFSLVFGGICYFGSQRVIGAINGCLVFGIIVSFTFLVGVASGELQWNSLLQAHFEAIPQSIPIIALAFVYQNVVPVLCTNLEGNLSKVRTAIVFGTAVPLVLFLIWDAVILGTIPNLNTSSSDVSDPLELLRSNNGIVGPIVEAFSFLAIATSYIGFVLGLSDFVSDLLKLPSGQSKPLPYLLTLLPPLVLSLLDPEIFFKALDFAGTYGVLVLFGVLPAAMAWSERYLDASQSPRLPPLVPGGKLTLSIVLGGALVVIFSEIYKDVINQ
ncbi:tyrosine-specific transport protein-like isoform X2 [Phoenix dactylifera]|uniref:Tyrosine-specific transport protein-like isoform X2 n=1 Tax=Phoenix dactylifera TaxID=42345 RepID=A0A8B8ZV66_PHODC|nr:tyrosine-specific transport protein-like isoform X2 [Phoenix dactylifera]